jgi:hypothetical protein
MKFKKLLFGQWITLMPQIDGFVFFFYADEWVVQHSPIADEPIAELKDRTEIPRYHQSDVVTVLAPYFANPTRHAIAHNATYDVRMLFRMGVRVACRVTCTLILTHRLDENLRSFGPNETIHYHLEKVTFGLKELTQVYFHQRPPSLVDIVGKKNTIHAPPHLVGEYCCQDTVNTYNLYHRAEKQLCVRLGNTTESKVLAKRRSIAVARLIDDIDDPNTWCCPRCSGRAFSSIVQRLSNNGLSMFMQSKYAKKSYGTFWAFAGDVRCVVETADGLSGKKVGGWV